MAYVPSNPEKFQKGFDFFTSLRQNGLQELELFQSLQDIEMDLKHTFGGPHSNQTQKLFSIDISILQNIKKEKSKFFAKEQNLRKAAAIIFATSATFFIIDIFRKGKQVGNSWIGMLTSGFAWIFAQIVVQIKRRLKKNE